VPPAQQERILNRHILGESMRRISREEHRDFRTIAKILRYNPAKLREHLEICRAQFCALAIVALETIRRAMENGDAEIAYRLLVDAGAVPPPGQYPWVIGPKKNRNSGIHRKEKAHSRIGGNRDGTRQGLQSAIGIASAAPNPNRRERREKKEVVLMHC